MATIWKNTTTNEIWHGQSIVYNGFRYFNPAPEILTAAGFVEETIEEPEVPISAQLKEYEDAVQAHLDSVAQYRGYDNTYTCLSYLNSSDPTWNAESHAFNLWRDSVWHKCHELLNKYQAGELEPITVEQLIAQLPEINWNLTIGE